MKKWGLLFVLALSLVLVACSSSDEGTSPDNANGKDDVTTIKVGTMGTYHPFSYEDENGELTGYDLEVLRLIEEVEPSLKFDIIAGPWDSLFVGLDSDKFQLIANQITATKEREAKYTLTKNQYFTSVSQLIVAEGTNNIKTLDDLVGKKIGLTTGDAHTFVVEDRNAANGNKITDSIQYYEQDITSILQDVVSGRIAATVNDPIVAKEKAEVQNLQVKVVGERLKEKPTYFIAKQDKAGKELIAKIDAALEKLIADGKLSALSQQYFGEDYSK